MWKEEEHGTAAVNVTRYEEAAATGAKTIAVGCPFCLTMMTDASKQADQGIKVKDVAEIIAERLESWSVEHWRSSASGARGTAVTLLPRFRSA